MKFLPSTLYQVLHSGNPLSSVFVALPCALPFPVVSISITGTKAVHNNPLTLFRHLVLHFLRKTFPFLYIRKKIKRYRRHKNHTPMACLLHLVSPHVVSSHMHTFEHRVHMQKNKQFHTRLQCTCCCLSAHVTLYTAPFTLRQPSLSGA